MSGSGAGAKTVTFRLDDTTREALNQLSRAHAGRSEAIRYALAFTARAEQRARLRTEAEQLAAGESDLAEATAVQTEMSSIRAW